METIDLDIIRTFVRVVQQASFSKAAALLKLPKSTVSKAISRLEKETGTKLLLRTTRSLTLTPAGRAFYEATATPVVTLEEAQKSLYGTDSILKGHIKITAPEDLGTFVIAPIVARLCSENPGLTFELLYTDEVLDLVKDGFDIAVRIGKVNESTFKIKRVGEVVLIPVASSDYLKKHPEIKHPKDLINHECLSISGTPLREHWVLKSSASKVKMPIRAKVSSNQMTTLMKVAVSGSGIALVPHFLCLPEITSGKLIRVLEDWSSVGLPVSVITPLSPTSSARLRIVRDAIVASLQENLLFSK